MFTLLIIAATAFFLYCCRQVIGPPMDLPVPTGHVRSLHVIDVGDECESVTIDYGVIPLDDEWQADIDRRHESRYDVWDDERRRDHYGPSGDFWK